MTWWYLSDLRRHKDEREALADLALRADWFCPGDWRVDERLRLIFDADLMAGGSSYPIALRYPESFPHTPPSVLPRGSAERWSAHQYGSGGELCLEFRADNWTPETMGFQMIESAYRLLVGENPAPGQHAVVASAHRTSQGQDIRGKRSRLLLTRDMTILFDSLAPGETIRANTVLQFREGGHIYVINKATLLDGNEWSDPSVPSTLALESYEASASIMRIHEGAALPSIATKAEFVAATSNIGCDVTTDVVVVLSDAAVRAYRLLMSDAVVELVVLPPQPAAARVGDEYAALSGKSVAVVGCGSLGSKIATMLARAGVANFLLVDDDILLPDNIVRNDLDWRDVGLHKADAVATKLRLVRPSTQTKVRRLQIGGQESATAADSILAALAGCDLVVDATANPAALNIISGVIASAKVPVVWAEVFAGGFGGLIARRRPGFEPTIPLMRLGIENWFAERNTPPIRAGTDYGQAGNGQPFIADDADVTAIAAPAARLALDCLLDRSPSFFPYSVYVIGLSPGPVFSQPFETFPIILDPSPETSAATPLEPEDALSEIDIIAKLFQRRDQ